MTDLESIAAAVAQLLDRYSYKVNDLHNLNKGEALMFYKVQQFIKSQGVRSPLDSYVLVENLYVQGLGRYPDADQPYGFVHSIKLKDFPMFFRAVEPSELDADSTV